jgi:hypothetical protein
MHTSRTVLITLAAVALAGCGDDAAGTSQEGATTAPTSEPAGTTPPTTDAALTTSDAPATTPASTPGTTAMTASDDAWREALAQRCASLGSALGRIPFPSSSAGVPALAEWWREFVATAPLPDALPDDIQGEAGDLEQTTEAIQREVDEAVAAATRDDKNAVLQALERADDLLIQTAGMSVVAGVECLGLQPSRAADAAVNAPVLGAWQIENAFGSIWVSKQFLQEVARIDPVTGEVTATIPVGSQPFKLQAADGRIWVRTADAFEAIDPATNTVTATLEKADVGPLANRSWAVDGAMWICDGTTLHRYDPTTLERLVSVDVGVECGQVHATSELVTAWTYNEDDGESRASAAVFLDPATNELLAELELPVDVGVPVVLDDRVFFPGVDGPTAVVVDRDSWTVGDAADYGRPTGGSQPAFDGSVIYLPTKDKMEILVVDPTSYAVVDTIRPLEANSVVAADGGGVWTASNTINFVQRFDRPS